MDTIRLAEQLKRHEGFRKYPYRDTVGKLTIGYGRNLDDVGLFEAEAEVMLFNDIRRADQACWSNISCYRFLDSVRQEVIVNMAFNMGITKLLGFKKMLQAIDERNWEEAADQMLDSKWSIQVGYRSHELADAMRTGKT